MGSASKILLGQKFGLLTVQYQLSERDKYGAILWHCVCECGRTKDVPSGKLNSGWTTSCGCKLSQDLTGQRFGYWTVLYKSKSTSQGVFWHCKCECGKEKDVSSHSLRVGDSKSCGCKRQKKQTSCISSLKIKTPSIIEGEKYNRLTAIKFVGKNVHGASLWLFKCDCGKEHITIASAVKNGRIRSCGCALTDFLRGRAYNLTGQKFGKLTAIRQLSERNKDGDILWECQCDCGRFTNVRTYHLTTGAVQSCGCLNSKGELLIEKLLKENNISFKTQKTFDDCRFLDTNYLAKFDFWIENKFAIEFDGEQHFIAERRGAYKKWQSLEYVQEHDDVKTNYCIEHNIPLIRIPYTHYDNLCIEDLLLETTQFRVV